MSRISRQGGIVGQAASSARSGGHSRRMLLDAGRRGHAVDEQHGAERKADDDALGEIAKDVSRNVASSTTASPRELRSRVRNACFSTMFQATTVSTPASAASGM